MIAFDVKNTTMRKLYEAICPHYCLGCGELGSILCECCKNHNISGNSEDMEVCLKCGMAVSGGGGCNRCDTPYDMGYAVGKWKGLIKRCISEYKYKSVRALKTPLAEMASDTLPCLAGNTVVVPVPTNTKHIRMRGLDHTRLLAKELARIRGWRCDGIIKRLKDNVQVGADEATRRKQAIETYALSGRIDENAFYVVIDDVWTTGSTMSAVCRILREAGAKNIIAIVLARA